MFWHCSTVCTRVMQIVLPFLMIVVFESHSQERCEWGKYGENCKKDCPLNCFTNPVRNLRHCHKETERCSEGCAPGWFDDLCDQACSPNCKGGACNYQNGICTNGCSGDYKGQFCNVAPVTSATPPREYSTYTSSAAPSESNTEKIPDLAAILVPVFLILVVVIAVVVIILCIYLRKRKRVETTGITDLVTGILPCWRTSARYSADEDAPFIEHRCEESCPTTQCKDSQHCSGCDMTGHCITECDPGYYDQICTSVCNKNCKNKKCVTAYTGNDECTEGCVPGYQGPGCGKPCYNPGGNCTVCPGGCDGGYCKLGSSCYSGCEDSYYGTDCKKCSRGCMACNRKTGTCDEWAVEVIDMKVKGMKNITVIDNETVTFRCVVQGYPPPDVSIVHAGNNTPAMDMVRKNKSVYERAVRISSCSQLGRYYCRVTSSSGIFENHLLAVELQDYWNTRCVQSYITPTHGSHVALKNSDGQGYDYIGDSRV